VQVETDRQAALRRVRHAAAIAVQTACRGWRGRQWRRDALGRRRLDREATKIQSRWRGVATRRALPRLVAESGGSAGAAEAAEEEAHALAYHHLADPRVPVINVTLNYTVTLHECDCGKMERAGEERSLMGLCCAQVQRVVDDQAVGTSGKIQRQEGLRADEPAERSGPAAQPGGRRGENDSPAG
jgi:hypothetical protein